ncbi:MAG: hypothetical protein NTY64_19050, partial [Deltaproteobacteria bacterium]|nr:hypothetical protein [Deltaproteobacteria bacterium]
LMPAQAVIHCFRQAWIPAPCLKHTGADFAGMTFDGFVKSPFAVLHGILRRCGVLPSAPHSSGVVRLASGAFYFAIHSDGFLRAHHA